MTEPSAEAPYVEDRSVLSRPVRAPDAAVRYGPGADQIADLYRAEAAVRSLVILIHGGYWRPEYDRAHLRPMAAALAEAGWTVALMEYTRVPGDPDAMLADVEQAARRLPDLVRRGEGRGAWEGDGAVRRDVVRRDEDECSARNGDFGSGRVIVVGHSAGGHLALCLAAKPDAVPLAGVLALAPVTDLVMADALTVDGGAVREFLGQPAVLRPDLDPCRLPSASMPVTLMHGDADTFAPQALSRSYVKVHPDTRAVWLPGVGHFALIDPQGGVWGRVLDELALTSAKTS